ncbi:MULTISPECIES: hypothetical protein [unclassified Glutamicibacter]|uniref:hypothetical protein n=1 Tax=unclassified Glutamicibacter TaxID=2627139 RepID=UPI003816B7B1
MINKIFDSDSTDNRVLEVGRNGERPWMNIRDGATGDKMFRIKLEDMPEILRSLADVTAGAKAEIKVRELAELEAEALELYNVCMTGHNLTSFDGLGGALRDQWLAVARKAREMRVEK